MLPLVAHHALQYVILEPPTSATVFTTDPAQHPSCEWRERLHVIHASNVSKTEALAGTASFKVMRRGAKRSRVSLVPEVHTSRADEVR